LTNRTIGILGCGWLGLPLAVELNLDAYNVKGTTTSDEKLNALAKKAINPYIIQVSEKGIEGNISEFLKDVEILIVTIPPALRKNPNANYVQKIQQLCTELKNTQLEKIIFISSISVYGDQEGEISEATMPKPKTASGKQLVQAENLLRNFKHTTIIRFGGLIGPNRHPVYHLSKKEKLDNGDELVNLIHLNDCIYMIKTIIEKEYWGELFNGVYPYHPTKKEYYIHEASLRGIDLTRLYESSGDNVKKLIINKNFNSKNHFLNTSIASSFTTKK
jgi:nucleoside-diphosphate-sugar epimerase